ncbi:hypothetical protein C8J56DRAFT_959509 [Mycena floridula]|nr:hypothetical protein C8J56DRAFT_959509 [Mycena floridula]
MKFSTIAAYAAAIGLSGAAFAAKMPMTSNSIVKGIDSVTVISQNTNVLIQPLSLNLGFVQIVTLGTSMCKQFSLIIAACTSLAAGTVSAVFTGDASHAIVVALVNFVKVHQLLLSTVIGKHGIFAACFFTAPVAVVLRALEAVVDTIAFFLIGCIAPSGPDHDMVVKATGSLKISVSQTVQVYSK